jgi:hypothetical protein
MRILDALDALTTVSARQKAEFALFGSQVYGHISIESLRRHCYWADKTAIDAEYGFFSEQALMVKRLIHWITTNHTDESGDCYWGRHDPHHIERLVDLLELFEHTTQNGLSLAYLQYLALQFLDRPSGEELGPAWDWIERTLDYFHIEAKRPEPVIIHTEDYNPKDLPRGLIRRVPRQTDQPFQHWKVWPTWFSDETELFIRHARVRCGAFQKPHFTWDDRDVRHPFKTDFNRDRLRTWLELIEAYLFAPLKDTDGRPIVRMPIDDAIWRMYWHEGCGRSDRFANHSRVRDLAVLRVLQNPSHYSGELVRHAEKVVLGLLY